MTGGGPSSPDTTSTEGSSSPPFAPDVSRACVAPAPKKKRVRRQQVELKHLRELAGKLERRLEQLKKRRLFTAQGPNGSVTRNGGSIQYGPASVWEAIADRQFKERARVEKRREELRTMLRTQTSTTQRLQAKVQKALGDKELVALTMMQLQGEGPRYWDLGSGDAEEIYADLLSLVVRIRLELQRRQVEDPRTVLSFATWGISVGEPHLRTDSTAGLLLETHGCSLLPFNVNTTAAACWKMFSLSHMNDDVTVSDKTTVQDDMVARSFTCSSTHFGRQIDVRGKHTCRKYVDEDGCVTIVFAGYTGPAEVNTPCQEVQLQKTGWIKVRQLRSEDLDQHSSAMVEMHSEMLPRFRNGNAGQDQRAREVIDWVSRCQHMANDWYRQKLSEILVEEDWKAFRGGDSGEMPVS
ncbi:hypothetical protein PHYPSEUDO_013591 [Phytophthora pseudosyringae]|uniref:M96 mating-specific protein family n=1 Tax=Phytophthora pseudosyringae TaxID=221518 RepID=A0A8T1V7U5_9STRA|nr:hypothetical protein PHYPSEUDO_013591 [Phytophthora pseudosyringae]